MKICKDEKQGKKESHLLQVFLLLPIFIWSLSHKPTIKNNYQMYLSGAVLKILVLQIIIKASLAEFIFSKIPCF